MNRGAIAALTGALLCRSGRPVIGCGLAVAVLSAKAAAGTISGVVFDDLAGNALAAGAETIGAPDNPVLAGVQVAVFADNGNNVPDGADTAVAGSPFTTDAAGRYTSGPLAAGTYWIRVDSTTVRSASEPTEPLTNIWAEQTYGPVGAWCADGAGGTLERFAVNGPCYSGKTAAVSDLPGALASSEHVARVVIGAPDLTDADFGFSFNVVTTVRGGRAADNDNPAAGRIVQGAVNQFVQNATALAGPNVSYFVPTEPPNGFGAGQSWWRVDVSRVSVVYNSNSVFLEMIDTGTELDGTAYQFTDGVTVRNTNSPGVGNSGPVGVGPDGLASTGDEVILNSVPGPELAIVNDRATLEVARGIDIHGFGMRVRNLAVYGFGDTASVLPGSDIYVGDNTTPGIDPTDDVQLRNLVIGLTPTGADPVVNRSYASAIEVHRTTNGLIQNVLAGMTRRTALFISGGNDLWQVSDSEIRDVQGAGSDGVLVSITTGVTSFRFIGNLISANNDEGFSVSTSGLSIRDNTISGNNDKGIVYGFGSTNNRAEQNLFQNNGVGVAYNNSANGNFLIRNQITDSVHSGVRMFSGANNNLISQNAIFDNGPSPVDNIGIDLYTSADTGDGTPPFVTLNDSGDGDSGANDLINFPVIERAGIVGPNLELSGWARPGSIIEFFVAAPDPRQFGEAQAYVTTLTEGSAADTDATVSAYSGLINGIDHGSDTTNRFFFSIPVPAGVSDGTVLTSTATDAANNTSEFSGNVTVIAPRRMEKRAYSLDGTPIPDGATLPDGFPFYYMLYINNEAGAFTDVSVRDVLDPAFAFQAGTVRVDDTQGACTGPCTPAEESAAFSAALGTAVLSDAVDGDVFSYTAASATLDFGNQHTANAQLDIPANRIWAAVFQARTQ